MLHRLARRIHPIAKVAPKAVGIGAIGMGLTLSLGQGLQAERSSERLQQKRRVVNALEPQRSVSTSRTAASGQTASHYTITPERRALLNTIRFAEGTWKNGRDLGYRILYGGGQFDDLSRHPDRVVVESEGDGHATGPAGAGDIHTDLEAAIWSPDGAVPRDDESLVASLESRPIGGRGLHGGEVPLQGKGTARDNLDLHLFVGASPVHDEKAVASANNRRRMRGHKQVPHIGGHALVVGGARAKNTF